MSIGKGYALSGWMQGNEQRRQRGRQEVADQQRAEAHDMRMGSLQQQMDYREQMQPLQIQQAEQSLAQNATSFEQSQQLWQQQQEKAAQRQQLNQALARFEIGNDPSQLFAVGQSMGLIQEPPERTENGWRINGQTYQKEDLMGLGASLLQPGTLTQIRQQRAAAEAEAEQARMEAMRDETKSNQVIMQDGSLGVLITNPDGTRTVQPAQGADGGPAFLQQYGDQGGIDTAALNVVRNTLSTSFKLAEGMIPEDGAEEHFRAATRIAERALQAGISPLEAAGMAHAAVMGPLSEDDAKSMAEQEAKDQGLTNWAGSPDEEFVAKRAAQLMQQSRIDYQRAAEMNLIPEGERLRGSETTSNQEITDEQLLEMY